MKRIIDESDSNVMIGNPIVLWDDEQCCNDIWACIFFALFAIVNPYEDDVGVGEIKAFLDLRTISKNIESIIILRVLKSVPNLCRSLLRMVDDYSFYTGLEKIQFTFLPRTGQLNSLTTLKKLKTLKCSSIFMIETETDVFSKLTQLNQLKLPIRYNNMNTISMLTNLTSIGFIYPHIHSLSVIPNTTKLEKLWINDEGNLKSISILPLQTQFNNLKKLYLRMDLGRIKLELHAIAHCTQLTSLKLYNYNYDQVLGRQLEFVAIDNALEGLTNLVRLDLTHVRIHNDSINCLLQLTRLECNNIITNTRFRSIENLTRLTRLRFELCIPFFKVPFLSVEFLTLRYSNIGESIASFTNLTKLIMNSCPVRVASLCELPKLRILNLAGSSIDNPPGIKKLTSLKFLKVYSCPGLQNQSDIDKLQLDKHVKVFIG